MLISMAVPAFAAVAVGIAGLATRREIVYAYENLAPHVRRIIERERVKAEIDAANRIQAALLPLEAPSVIGATVSSHYQAATEIGAPTFFASAATTSSTLVLLSMTKSWLRKAISLRNLAIAPSTIFSTILSGLPDSFAFSAAIERSRSTKV